MMPTQQHQQAQPSSISSSKPSFSTENNLPSHAITTLLSNLHTEAIASSSSAPKDYYTLISPNGETNSTQESTSTLLAARALAKAGHTKEAWDILDSLFVTQGENGFLPRYRYAAVPPKQKSESNEDEETNYYIKNSTLPNYPLFHSSPPPFYAPPSSSSTTTTTTTSTILHGSGRIAAPPFHSSILLDVFYTSPQTSYDLEQLGLFYTKLYKHHEFYHEVVMRGCGEDGNYENGGGEEGGKNEERSEYHGDGIILHQEDESKNTPCYNALHPWETELELNSPIWDVTLQPIIQQIKDEKWKTTVNIPDRVKQAYNYPGDDVYNAMLYLLECQSNATSSFENENYKPKQNDDATHKFSSIHYENTLLSSSSCHPHALLDVSIASALSKSDEDLYRIANILYDKNYFHNDYVKLTHTHWSTMEKWRGRSATMLQSLWNEEYGGFQGKLVVFDKLNGTAVKNGTDTEVQYVWNESYQSLNVPVGDIFLGAWGMNTQSTTTTSSANGYTEVDKNDVIGAMSFRLLQSDLKQENQHSFQCGLYPIPSVGGCSNNSSLSSHPDAVISPTRNYWSARGFETNGAIGIGRYLIDSTLHMMCRASGLVNNTSTNAMDNVVHQEYQSCLTGDNNKSIFIGFGDAYNVNTGKIIHTSTTTTSTVSAAIAYDLAIPDKPFVYTPAPPISNSWVIVLIAVELTIAFGVGVSCLTLSWNLMRRLRENNDSDAFVRTARYQRYTASDLYGGDELFDSSEENRRDGGGGGDDGGLTLDGGGGGLGDEDLFGRSARWKRSSRESLLGGGGDDGGGLSQEEERALDALMNRHRREGSSNMIGGAAAAEEPLPPPSSGSALGGTFGQIISYANPFYFMRPR